MTQLTSRDVETMRALIAQRGLTREQVQSQFGLDDGTMGWLTNAGVSFSATGQPQNRGGLASADLSGFAANPASAQGTQYEQFAHGGTEGTGPAFFRSGAARFATRMGDAFQPGMNMQEMTQARRGQVRDARAGQETMRGLMTADIAAQGRGGDTQIAHVSPGEQVVPREVMAARPDVRQTIDSAIRDAGSDPRKYKVGFGPVNPRTGIQQFATDPNIADWYRNVAGRDATQGELDYWAGEVGQFGGEAAFGNFVNGLRANGERVNTADYAAANTAYAGPQSSNQGSYVDDWARNVFGRAATPEEIAQFGTASTPQESEAQYNAFVAGGQGAGGTFRQMSLYDASQIAAPGTTAAPAPAPAPAPVSSAPAPNYGSGTGLYDTMTVPTAASAQGATIGPTAQAAGSAPVVAGQGTAGTYTASTATAAPAVTAGAGTTQNATATNSAATGYNANTGTAQQWNVEDNQTVAGNVRDLIREGSPLQDLAQTRSLQQANARGLANSSMAVQSGQAALYDSVLPIAQQDASTRATAGQYNTGNRQQMELANMDARNVAAGFNANAQNDSSALNAQLGTQVSLANAQEFNAMTRTNLDRALQAGAINQEQANKMAALAAENINRAAEFNITTNAAMQQFNIDAALKAGIVNKQQADQLSMFNAEQQNRQNLAQAQLTQQNSQFNASESNDLLALGMDNQTKVELGTIEASYRLLMQSSASAGTFYQQTISEISRILGNPDMDGPAKHAAVANLVGVLKGGMAVIGGIANLDLPDLTMDDVYADAPAAAPSPAPAPVYAPEPG